MTSFSVPSYTLLMLSLLLTYQHQISSFFSPIISFSYSHSASIDHIRLIFRFFLHFSSSPNQFYRVDDKPRIQWKQEWVSLIKQSISPKQILCAVIEEINLLRSHSSSIHYIQTSVNDEWVDHIDGSWESFFVSYHKKEMDSSTSLSFTLSEKTQLQSPQLQPMDSC